MVTKVREEKKLQFLTNFEANGNISMACDFVGVSRTCFYKWCKEDKEFNETFTDIRMSIGDFVESQLMMLIKAGEASAIIFYSKTQLKNRGYVERLEQEQVGEQKIVIHETIITSDEYRKRRLSERNILDESEEGNSQEGA